MAVADYMEQIRGRIKDALKRAPGLRPEVTPEDAALYVQVQVWVLKTAHGMFQDGAYLSGSRLRRGQQGFKRVDCLLAYRSSAASMIPFLHPRHCIPTGLPYNLTHHPVLRQNNPR